MGVCCEKCNFRIFENPDTNIPDEVDLYAGKEEEQQKKFEALEKKEKEQQKKLEALEKKFEAMEDA